MAGSNFEMQLGQLADSQIAQDAPALTPYKVGFQVIDKNDDETRGVGVSVFKLNNQWIYIPVFYLNGRLKGTDLMYLPDRSQFVPTKETWITYLKGQQPITLGNTISAHSEDNTETMEGKPGSVNITEETPFFKGAALLEEAAWADMQKVVKFDQNVFDLTKWIPRFGKEASFAFTKTMMQHPAFANAILTFYSPGELQGLAKKADEVGVDALDIPAAKGSSQGQTVLKVLTPDSPDAADLKDAEKEVLLRDGVFVIDNRKETSTVFKGDVDHTKLKTPTCTGLYDVLMADGTFNRFYIVFPNKAHKESSKHQALSTTHARFVMIPLNNKDKFITPAMDTIQAKQLDIPEDEDTKLLKSLGRGIKRLIKERHNDVLVLDTYGNSYKLFFSGPLAAYGNKIRVNLVYGNGNGDTSCYSDESSLLSLNKVTPRKVDYLQFTNKPGKLFIGGDTLYVPNEARVVDRAPFEIKRKYGFGNPNTLVNSLINKVQLKPLKVYSDGSSIILSNEDMSEGPLNKRAALLKLVKDYGIAAPTAKKMVKEASAPRKPNSLRYLIKLAAEPFMNTAENSIGAAAAPDTIEEVTEPQEGLKDIETAIAASEKGVKEVMDVSVLRSLAMNNRSLDLVDDYLPDLLKGLDRVGRLLFLFYWHNDDFQDRYGAEDLAELEESLRDVFQSLSDLVLFLSKKTVSADASAEAVAGDLTEDLGA